MILAVLRIPQNIGAAMTEAQTRMLHSVIESAALALERLRSLQQQVRSREETTRERYRGNLLRAISHDIRTPLSGIMGTSEMLMASTDRDDPRYAQARDINQDAQWLHNMVENILNLTKLQDGKLVLHKQPEAVEEVVGAALTMMEKRLPGRNIDVEMPDNVVMVPMDARLISQVLINLLDNADKHTAQDRQISVSVCTDEKNVCITVADRGKGIPERDLPHIFQMFYTAHTQIPDSRRGVGLGLAICQSIVEAHGGNIRAENRKDGGAAFTFTLPTEGENE
ncbi:MAG: ATP-binding protein [Clostridia bacterium]|nr:ATP-binding protein [Clostridia bacterium]